MLESWEPIIRCFLKGLLITRLGTVIHEAAHYVTTKASGGEILGLDYNLVTGVVTMTVEAPAPAYPLIRLSGGLAEAAYYALLSVIDRKLLVPAAMWAGFSYFEMERNNLVLSILGPLAELSVFIAQALNIPEGEIV